MEMLNMPVSKQEIFRDIDRIGEELKKEFRELSEKAERKIESQVQTTKFETAYALNVSNEQRKKTIAEVKDIRSDLWKKALDKAKGDEKKASIFYEELCAFP